jgi:hypothetical protein
MCEQNAGEGSLLPAWHWRLVCLKSQIVRGLPLPVLPADARVPVSKQRKGAKKPSRKRKSL